MSWSPLPSTPGAPPGPTEPASRLPASNITPGKQKEIVKIKESLLSILQFIQPYSRHEIAIALQL